MTATETRYARYSMIDRLQAEGHLRNTILAGRHDSKLTEDDRADAARFLDRRSEHNSHGGRWNEREAAFRTKVVRHG